MEVNDIEERKQSTALCKAAAMCLPTDFEDYLEPSSGIHPRTGLGESHEGTDMQEANSGTHNV
eukprot:11524825-Ditylum_brightwellii.AAC.1